MASLMYEFLLECWVQDKVTVTQVDYAFTQGWVTAGEADAIKAAPQVKTREAKPDGN